MSNIEIGLVFVAVLIGLLLMGTQVGFTLIIVAFVGFAIVGGLGGAIANLFIIPFSTLNNYNFAVIPLYLLMSELVSQSGIGRETYMAARAWLGQFKGGLAMATIGACGLFACVSGSSLAGTLVMGKVAYPEMKNFGYNDLLSTAVTTAGGTLGILIPPSIGFIIIGILANMSIGKLFMSGILPGISVIVFYWITIAILCKVNPSLAPGLTKTTYKEKLVSIKLTWPIVLLFLLMMGGLYGGVFTATEAAGIGAFGAFIIALAKKQMSTKTFWSCLMETSKMAGTMIILVVGSFMFNSFLAITQIPNSLGMYLAGLAISKYAFLAIIIIFYLVCGMFFDSMSILILTIPIFFPAVQVLGFDLIWYSVIMVRCVEVGFISPPFGMNMFALAGIINVPLATIYRGIIPFCISDICNIIFLVIFPSISTFIPSQM